LILQGLPQFHPIEAGELRLQASNDRFPINGLGVIIDLVVDGECGELEELDITFEKTSGDDRC
jgi:hypothetical protein